MRIYSYVYLGVYASFGSPRIPGSPRCTHAMLVYLDVAGVEHDPFHVWAVRKVCGQLFPKACFCKPSESDENTVPVPIIWGEISPRRTRTHDPRNSVEKAPVVSGRATALPRSIGEEGSNLAPKFVSDVMALIAALVNWSDTV